MAAAMGLPMVDLAPFFTSDREDDGARAARASAIEAAVEACRTYGFFRVVNHGVPHELVSRLLELSSAFFALPDEEKAKVAAETGRATPIPAGYYRLPSHSPDNAEYLLMYQAHLGHNLYPAEPHEFRETLDECHEKMAKLGILVQEILAEGMGLPPGFFRKYTADSDSSFHFLAAVHYFPATEEDGSVGLNKHEDGKALTFVLQDTVGGLEVLKDGEWVPIEPIDGTIIINIGDLIQVLTNKKLKSATHRVVRKPGMHRHSMIYVVNVDADKWIEPLPEFTDKVGEPPRYRGFRHGEYVELRKRNKFDPPATPEKFYNINYYAI
uniref:Uncharacterized protein n=1 Tax=Avena sativa TaxID=4498 RepID=A0ACD5TT94_AVESA